MGQHFYTPEGKDMYTVIGANGKERDTNIRDARKHGYIPSVTTILNVLNAPELSRWKEGRLLEAAKTKYQRALDVIKLVCEKGVTLQQVKDYALKANHHFAMYEKEVRTEAFEKSKTATDYGSLLHSYLEKLHMNQRLVGFDAIPEVTKVLINDHFKDQVATYDAIEKTVVSKNLLYAGKPDLVCTLRDGRLCVYDYKNQGTIDAKGKSKKIVYYEKSWMQCAAYAKAVDAECVRILTVSRDEPDRVEFKEIDGQELKDYYTMFHATATMYHYRGNLRKDDYDEENC